MRTNCKTCEGELKPSKHSGARHVYCVACDRESARERMRRRRALNISKAAESMYYKPKYGYVYIIYNPSFKGWIKVGSALDALDRLNSFQTGSPYRNYQLKWFKKADNKLLAELEAHNVLSEHFEKRGEWFKAQPWQARRLLRKLQWVK